MSPGSIGRPYFTKKIALTAATLLVYISGFGQKSQLVGLYETYDNYDTSVRVYMSYDSVKQISSTIKRTKNNWLQVRWGTWKIKDGSPTRGYTVVFSFNDGTSEEVWFGAAYLSRPEGDLSPLPDFYSLHIGYTSFGKTLGKGGLMERLMEEDAFHLKSQPEN